MNIDRRTFLQAASAAPFVWSLGRHGSWIPGGDPRCLLVLELEGGNDGLSTVIPVDDAEYPRLRASLSSVRKGARALGDGTSLHPSLVQLHAHITGGRGAIVHGVGYAQPDRSHFRSRDIWHVADPEHQRVSAATTGWMGRAAEQLASASAGLPAVAIGGLQVPLVLHSHRVSAPSLVRATDFQWLSPTAAGPMPHGAATRAVASAAEVAGLARTVADVQRAGIEMADGLTAALQRYQPKAEYPPTALGRHLQLAAQMLIAGTGTRLLHVPFGGFDTHARQLPTHAGLLAQLDAALAALLLDLAAHGCAERVAILVHSEFGRRAAENASLGTDHGAAGPVMLFGGAVRAGPHGVVPDLGQLREGDVPATCDFRRIYAELLRWLAVPVPAVLGAEHEPLGLW